MVSIPAMRNPSHLLQEKTAKWRLQGTKTSALGLLGTAPLTGEQAQATLRGRPRGRLGAVGSGKGCLRGRPGGRLGPIG